MSNEYRNNHYVPVWYQRRFLSPQGPTSKLFYLDLHPPVLYRGRDRSVVHGRSLELKGLKTCFAQSDFYTQRLGAENSRVVEQLFFGEVDSVGKRGVEFLEKFSHFSGGRPEFDKLLRYLSAQKLRTPKGLQWIAESSRNSDRNSILELMVRYHTLFAAIWAECVWQIADASGSSTKFIVSDHPVTVYNRRCGPRSQICRGSSDPPIWWNATHTIFPISLEKVLILTNLSWVRNPYQRETVDRPNSNPLRGALLHINDIQVMRQLDETEVRQINFIIKQRALRYVAASAEEWLYPERHVSKSDWSSFGNGYLLMPDPRSIDLGGDVLVGFQSGPPTGFDSYGRRLGDPEYGTESRSLAEGPALRRFKAEFAQMLGKRRRGRSVRFGTLEEAEDSDEVHRVHLAAQGRLRRTKQ